MNCRASRIDDLYSLLCVAYKFVFESLPWDEDLQELFRENPDESSVFERIFKLRLSKIHIFEKVLARESKELKGLFVYILSLRT